MKNITKLGLAGLAGYILLKRKFTLKTSPVPVDLEKKTSTMDSLKKQWLSGKITILQFQEKIAQQLGK